MEIVFILKNRYKPEIRKAETIYFKISGPNRVGQFRRNDPGKVLYHTSLKFVILVGVRKLSRGTPLIEATGLVSNPNPVSIKSLVQR